MIHTMIEQSGPSSAVGQRCTTVDVADMCSWGLESQCTALASRTRDGTSMIGRVMSCRWEELVTIVASDMRSWEAPELADILVSELLGSFGDNELSPECLDGAQKFLKPGGVSIPASSTSQLHPVTASKLWTDANVSVH